MAKIPPFLPTTTVEAPQEPDSFNKAFDYFQSLRDYVKFWAVLMFFILLLLILLWNIQPWFEIEIKPAKASASSSMMLDQRTNQNLNLGSEYHG